MADIRPFPGLHYNPAKVETIADVIAPPYDVISEEQKKQYLQQSPWNIVRLILPDGEDPYENARKTLESWIAREVLIRDTEPTLYCYHQIFRTPDGQEKTRKGFMARVRLEDFGKGSILPHESTLSAPKEDRFRLLRSCKTNFSPIFGLYADPQQRIDGLLDPLTSAPPRFKAEDDGGVTNILWSIKEESVLRQIRDIMKEHWILIADGHHRYESCVAYRDEMSRENKDTDAPFQFTLMFLTNIHHPGITILPYNRAVLNLPEFNPDQILAKAKDFFELKRADDHRQASNLLRDAYEAKTPAFVAALRGTSGETLFQLKPDADISRFYPPDTPEIVQKLDVNILHRVFLSGILGITDEDLRAQTYLKYYKNEPDEKKDFDQGKLQMAVYMNPTRVEQVVEVSRAGLKMPQKSTFFYPKVMTGFVLNQH